MASSPILHKPRDATYESDLQTLMTSLNTSLWSTQEKKKKKKKTPSTSASTAIHTHTQPVNCEHKHHSDNAARYTNQLQSRGRSRLRKHALSLAGKSAAFFHLRRKRLGGN